MSSSLASQTHLGTIIEPMWRKIRAKKIRSPFSWIIYRKRLFVFIRDQYESTRPDFAKRNIEKKKLIWKRIFASFFHGQPKMLVTSIWDHLRLLRRDWLWPSIPTFFFSLSREYSIAKLAPQSENHSMNVSAASDWIENRFPPSRRTARNHGKTIHGDDWLPRSRNPVSTIKIISSAKEAARKNPEDHKN